MKILTNIKNNPKKSIFGFIVVGFGGRWLHTKFTDYQFRLQKCREVFHRGKQPMNHLHPPKRIVLVLNPAAKHGKAGKLFKKNASPLLQLSGCEVKVFQLEYEGEGKSLMEELDLDRTDMVVAAGGDGTVNEVVTGLLRRKDHSRWVNIPLGIIPLGALNTVCQRLSSPNSFNSQAKWIISCTNHILDSNTRYVDALEVKSDVGKQTFALTDFAWGSYRDAFHKEPKYWYFGPIKRHMAYFISALKSKIQTPKQFQLAYNEPTLIHDKVETTPIIPMGQNVDFGNIIWKVFGSLLPSWFVSGGAEQEGKDGKGQDDTGVVRFDEPMKSHRTLEFNASVNSHDLHEDRETASAHVIIESDKFNLLEFVKHGASRFVGGKHLPVDPAQEVFCSAFQIIPNKVEEEWFTIDNEQFEAFTCNATIIPKCLSIIYGANMQ